MCNDAANVGDASFLGENEENRLKRGAASAKISGVVIIPEKRARRQRRGTVFGDFVEKNIANVRGEKR
ncbi:MAG: hypothetical protein IJO46_00225 [Thermoguttaceae bacterium]|nr:hypothetical protein [Thermoguttaceae bacterium]